MTLTFDGTTNQNITLSNSGSLLGLTNASFLFWINITSLPFSNNYIFAKYSVNIADEFGWISSTSTFGGSKIELAEDFSTQPGSWYATAPTTGTLGHVAITYNRTSTTNDPVFYVNGSLASVTESVTPSGSARSGTGSQATVGAYTGQHSFAGGLHSFCIYNRILSATEILDAYNSRKAIPTYNGLVFAPDLRGAAGGVDEGDTLGATNYIRDRISGATGTPSGSPVFAADNYLNY